MRKKRREKQVKSDKLKSTLCRLTVFQSSLSRRLILIGKMKQFILIFVLSLIACKNVQSAPATNLNRIKRQFPGFGPFQQQGGGNLFPQPGFQNQVQNQGGFNPFVFPGQFNIPQQQNQGQFNPQQQNQGQLNPQQQNQGQQQQNQINQQQPTTPAPTVSPQVQGKIVEFLISSLF